MADRMFLVPSSPEDFYRDFVPSEMIDSLLAISRLDEAEIDQLSRSLEAADGLLDEPRLNRVVSEVIADSESADAVVSTLQSVFPGSVGENLETLKKWRQAVPNHAERFPEDSFEAIQEYLPKLIRPYPALERYRKARRLATFTGKQAIRIDLICDARPIFDADRDEIEGFISQMTLRIIHHDQAGQAGEYEVVLSPTQLAALIEQAEKARRKLGAVTALIEEWLPGRMVDAVEQESDATSTLP